MSRPERHAMSQRMTAMTERFNRALRNAKSAGPNVAALTKARETSQ